MSSSFRRQNFVIALAATLCLFSVAGVAQNKAPTPKEGSGPQPAKTPRTADGHPDLTGFWGSLFANFGLVISGKTVTAGWIVNKDNEFENDKDKVAARVSQFVGVDPNDPSKRVSAGHVREQAAEAKNPNLVPPYKPELLAKVQDLNVHGNQYDPVFHCLPPGVPRMGPPLQIIQPPGQVVFLYELIKGANYFRVIPTNGTPHHHDDFSDASPMGDSVGHWEGDTLVVDSTNLSSDTWLGADGWFHSDKLHVVERLTRSGDTIKYEVTVEDPEVLTRPWVQDPKLLKLNKDPNARIFEQGPCIETDSEHLVNNDRNN